MFKFIRRVVLVAITLFVLADVAILVIAMNV